MKQQNEWMLALEPKYTLLLMRSRWLHLLLVDWSITQMLLQLKQKILCDHTGVSQVFCQCFACDFHRASLDRSCQTTLPLVKKKKKKKKKKQKKQNFFSTFFSARLMCCFFSSHLVGCDSTGISASNMRTRSKWFSNCNFDGYSKGRRINVTFGEVVAVASHHVANEAAR